jgi:hypothetical protein
MQTINCAFCGGVVRDHATIEYRPPRSSAQVALSHMGACACTPPIVYEDSPLDHVPTDDASVERVRQVERVEPVERRERDAPAHLPDRSDPWKGAA